MNESTLQARFDRVATRAKENVAELRTFIVRAKSDSDIDLGDIVLEMRIDAVTAEGFSPDSEQECEDAEDVYMFALSEDLSDDELKAIRGE